MQARPHSFRSRVRMFGAAILAVAALVAGPPSIASAGSVTLKFDSTTSSAAVSFKYTTGGTTTSASGTPGPYYWHDVSAATPYTTFCVELNQFISTGSQYTFTTTPLASQSGVTALEATDITKLWGAYYNSAWNSTSFAGSTQSTAFQLALWKLVYDGGTNLNLTTGNFQLTGATATSAAGTLAQSWLNALASTSSTIFATNFSGQQLVWLSNGSAQDQLTMIPSPPPPPSAVPAPAGVVLAGMGFLGLIGRNFRRRATPEAVA